jgi:hypothetical protein
MKDFCDTVIAQDNEDGLITKDGLKISFSRRELNKQFGVLLEKRPLECLIGETAYWLLIPSLAAIYSFPVILFISQKFFYTIMASLGLMMSTSLFNQNAYNYHINKYLIRPAAHPLVKTIFILIFAALVYQSTHNYWHVITPFIWWIFNDRIPLIYLISEMLMVKVKKLMYKLADPDGVLRRVAIYWVKKYKLSSS